MPNDEKRSKERTQEEIDAEKFRTFFSTSIEPVSEELDRQKEEDAQQKSLLGKLFRREKMERNGQHPPMDRPTEMPTGEILLSGSPDEEEPQANLQMALHDSEKMLGLEEKEPAKPAPKKQEAAPAAPKPEKPENTARPRSPMEQREDAEMQELKAMLFGKPKKAEEPAPKPAQPAPKHQKPKETPSRLTGLFFAEEKNAQKEPVQFPPKKEAAPEPKQPTPEGKKAEAETPAFRFFGKGDDEVKAPTRTTARMPLRTQRNVRAALM